MPTQGASFLLRPILDRFDCCLLAGKITGPRIGEMAERFVQYTAQAAEENAAFPLRADKSSPLKRHPPLRECIGSSSMQSSFLPRKGVSYVASGLVMAARSAERRVGAGCVRACRFERERYTVKRKQIWLC